MTGVQKKKVPGDAFFTLWLGSKLILSFLQSSLDGRWGTKKSLVPQGGIK